MGLPMLRLRRLAICAAIAVSPAPGRPLAGWRTCGRVCWSEGSPGVFGDPREAGS